LTTACQEAVWLRRLLSDIGLKHDVPSTIFEDNQGAIKLSIRIQNFTTALNILTCLFILLENKPMVI
jgi:hypothetical protein